ncbi:hypothetical protein DL96DRAFT_1711018 [Flagelloscypha sp. PMI_526]|nr:hypothetical protein DL96DRAFT_1711018 [Flagelloscypha sp. PMI_526]
MAPTFPADLFPEVLQFLSEKHLKTCSLVCSDFQHLAQPRLFWEIKFDISRQDHWDFFAAAKGKELCSQARSLYHNHSFLRLRHLSCGFLGPESIIPSFWPSIIEKVCPLIRTLTLRGMKGVPLRKVLASSPLLESLTLLSIQRAQSTKTAQPPPTLDILLPRIRALVVGNGVLDVEFGHQSPLARIQSIEYLELRCDVELKRAVSLEYLRFSKHNLRHVSFGLGFYTEIISSNRGKVPPQMELSELPQLEKMSFTIESPPNKERWFTWLARQLQQSPPASLRNVQISLLLGRRTLGSQISRIHPEFVGDFDELAQDSCVSIRFLVQAEWFSFAWAQQRISSDYEDTAKFIKEQVPTWWNTGKLEVVREWL